jgi:hypothetical protein
MLVVHTDNHYDYVNDFMLDGLIKSKQIVKFKRNAEWVNVGAEPIIGYKVILIDSLLISNYVKMSLRKTKTDKKDAVVIAQFLLSNGQLFVHW